MYPFALRSGQIGSLRLPNRILMGSMHLGLEAESSADALVEFYAERARGQAALLITGGSAISRVAAGGRHYSFINEPADAERLQTVVQAVHSAGGRIALQLFHAGRYGSESYFGLQPLAPSAIPSRFTKAVPRAMSAADIAQTCQDFASGARRARELGFDAVEVMGSEGYLLNQFLSPLTNQRDDPWGGDFVRRTRFPLEVLQAVRAAVSSDYAVIYRLSGVDLMVGSTTDEETCEFARLLQAAGADGLDVGVGWHESSVPTVQGSVPPGAWVPYAERIKQSVGALPVIASTRIPTLTAAEELLARQRIDFVAMARPFLADAALVTKAQRGERANPCIACNQACIERSLQDQAVSCMVNPRAGHEQQLRETPSRRRGAFAVIGGGPAGLEAARACAAMGHRVTLFEAADALGGQFRLASRIPGKQMFADSVAYFTHELQRLRVDIRLREPLDAHQLTRLNDFDGVIIATGVLPRQVTLPGSELPHVRSYPDALLTDPAAASVAIIGAGGIGVDVAHLYSERGRAVTLLCRGSVIGQHIGRSTRWVVLASLRAHGVQLLTGVTYERIEPDGLRILDREGQRRFIAAEAIVVAAGQLQHSFAHPALAQLRVPYRIVGGARGAERLDAVRAFREGACAAHELIAVLQQR